jgi:hypothetical protein
MDAHEKTTAAQVADPLQAVKVRRAERDRRIAEIRARKSEIKVEPSPGLKELVDSQDEFRDRLMSNLRTSLGA